jgi:hypothetical protein
MKKKSILHHSLDLPSMCGAITRQGTPCQRAPMIPSLRCSKHGGKTPIKHGDRSKYASLMRKKAKLLRKELHQQQNALKKAHFHN